MHTGHPLSLEQQAVAELYLRNDWLKKSLTGQGVILDDE